jgi:hypothetical protein
MPLSFGTNPSPGVVTTYFDAVFSSSLANYRKTLIDNIGASNAFLNAILKSGQYESAEGGTHFQEPLMYAFSPFDSYDGYDELSTQVTDGITSAQFEWRQGATPVGYSMKEVIQNKNQIFNLVKAKMTQAEMGIQEGFAQAFMWGNWINLGTAASLEQPRVSNINSSLFIDPLPKLVDFTPLTGSVGNIDQGLYPWWRNRTFTSTATTYSQYIYELMNAYNTISLGTGGHPTHILMDQISFQQFEHAYFKVFKSAPDAPKDEYPFVAKKFMQALVIMDDKVPDVFSGIAPTLVAGSGDPTSMPYGTAYFLNEKFFKIRYQPERDFEMLKDENGKTFAKPINGDSRIGHIAWMGAVTCNNRRKQGVLGKIARTFTET